MKDFKVARCVKPLWCKPSTQAELHHFSDASNLGYGTVSYLRVIADQHTENVTFMLGKARVAPLKQITIPRLELTAAMLAVKVDKLLRKELEINLKRSIFWTDSQSVLKYIGNECSRFHTFVANRTSYIRENTDLAQWRYIETKLNPADKASRGVSASTLLNCTEWIQGPKFLWKEEQDWPQNLMVSTFSLSTDDPEVRRVATVCNTVIQNVNNPTNQLLTYFSSWTKLRRAVVWFLKLKKILQSLCAKRKRIQSLSKVQTCTRSKAKMLNDEMNVAKNSFKFQPITLDDLLMAEKAIVTFCQREVFENEI